MPQRGVEISLLSGTLQYKTAAQHQRLSIRPKLMYNSDIRSCEVSS